MRSVLCGLCVSLSLVSATNAAETSTAAVAAAMTKAAEQFLAGATPEGRQGAVRDFDDAARLDWHNIPKPQRKGLQFRDMTARERELCHALLQTGLSESGYEKARLIMSLESNLREGEKHIQGGNLRDPERYFLTIFGTPTTSGPWGWSFEGHHFSLNFAVADDAVIADSPSFWGANPATVRIHVAGGPEVGTRTLAAEEQRAFDLLALFSADQRKAAIIAETAPDDYRSAGKPQPPARVAQGLSATQMTAEQQQALRQLLAGYCSHLAPALAEARMAEIDADGWSQVYFAWAGATKPGVGHYYRVECPSAILELINVQSDPQGNPANHIHSVWRSPRNDFGIAAN